MAIAKVLLVDDERAFVDTMVKRLNRREVEILPAYNGKEALDQLSAAGDIEVVILDIKMPVMDGMEALAKIKNKYPLVEVIMLTGHATVETGIEGMKMGAFDYLMKPCNVDELLQKVEAAARKKREHEEKIMQARLKAITLRIP